MPTDEEIEALLETVSVPGESPRERFSDHLKKPLNDDDGTEWDPLLNTYDQEFEAFYDALDEVLLSTYPDTASNQQLDRLGTRVGIDRQMDESDAQFRIRIKVQLRKQVGGGSIEGIKTAAALLLETGMQDISLVEDFDNRPAAFELPMSEELLNNAGVSSDDFLNAISEIKAAGVEVNVTLSGSFTFRSYQDLQDGVNNPDLGWSGVNYDGPAGEWAGLLGQA